MSDANRGHDRDENLRCPTCGVGVVTDITYNAEAGTGDLPAQQPGAQQLTAYSCGHEVLGARLATADTDRLDVEQRTSEETVDP